MSPEEIRNQCEDDADRAPSDLTVWRDRGAIIAQQQARIAQLEEQVARVQALASGWGALGDASLKVLRLDRRDYSAGELTMIAHCADDIREALS